MLQILRLLPIQAYVFEGLESVPDENAEGDPEYVPEEEDLVALRGDRLVGVDLDKLWNGLVSDPEGVWRTNSRRTVNIIRGSDVFRLCRAVQPQFHKTRVQTRRRLFPHC